MSYVPAEPPYGDFRPPRDQLLRFNGERWQPVTSYEEWRVTGTADRGARWFETWSETEDSDAQAKARAFATWAETQNLAEGPYLHRRTVTVTEWEEAP